MPKKLENYIVICNWNDRGYSIIKEIHSDLAAPDTEIIVITEKHKKKKALQSDRRVRFKKADPTSHGVLEKARVHLAKSVIILADSESQDPDGKAALISLAITKLKKDSGKEPHIIAEITSPHKKELLEVAGVTELVCSTDYGFRIMAQCAVRAKLSEVYQQLLAYSEETNEIYFVDSDQYPERFKDRSLKEVARIINDNRDPENPTILLGVKRGEKIRLNPREEEEKKEKEREKEKEFHIREGDTLIVMAYKQPDLTYLETK